MFQFRHLENVSSHITSDLPFVGGCAGQVPVSLTLLFSIPAQVFTLLHIVIFVCRGKEIIK